MAKPLSVDELIVEASSFQFQTTRPMKQWIRAAKMLLTEAAAYERDGNLSLAFVYTYRHAELILTKLPQHPDYNNAAFKAELSQAKRAVLANIEKMESWKPAINQEHLRYQESLLTDRVDVSELEPRAADGTSSDDYMESVREIGRLISQHRQPAAQAVQRPRESNVHMKAYPNIPVGHGGVHSASQALKTPLPVPGQSTRPPPLPSKESVGCTNTPPKPPKVMASIPPQITAASSKRTFAAHARAENGRSLRTLLLPPDLRPTFLALAHANTTRNLETCGVLAAQAHGGALFVTHLVVPGQTATPDTCDTTEAGDAALFDFCDARGLLVCGWVHTHPRQTCFLSSRDLHTSAGYQVMLPEAIAIVCAPAHEPGWGIFRLTDPPGLSHVLDCTRSGTFHQHALGDLYTDAYGGTKAMTAGHVVEGPGLEVEVVDLR